MSLLKCDENCKYKKNCVDKKLNEEIIQNDLMNNNKNLSDILEGDKLVMYACNLGQKLKDNELKNTQIRRFYDAVKKIEGTIKREKDENLLESAIKTKIVLLKPQLAYATAKKPALEPLHKVMAQCLDISKYHQVKDAKILINFFQSIVAYHKAWGGE